MKKEIQELIVIRDGQASDEKFIYSSWLKSYRNALAVADVRTSVYFKEHHDIIENILNRDGTVVKVMCLKDDPFVLLGWLCYNEANELVHYTFVKESWRRTGIAKALVETVPFQKWEYTHKTKGPKVGVKEIITNRGKKEISTYLLDELDTRYPGTTHNPYKGRG